MTSPNSREQLQQSETVQIKAGHVAIVNASFADVHVIGWQTDREAIAAEQPPEQVQAPIQAEQASAVGSNVVDVSDWAARKQAAENFANMSEIDRIRENVRRAAA